MIGGNKSFCSKLKLNVPSLITIKCLCHFCHLAAEYACRVLPKNLDFMVRESHNWFSCSTKRQINYKTIYRLVNGDNDQPKKIVKLSGTRWLARHAAIKTILHQYDALKLHFELAKEKDRCYTAQRLYDMYRDEDNRIYLVFLSLILSKVTAINKLFQSDSVDPLKLFDDLYEILYSLLQKIVIPQHLKKTRRQNLEHFEFRQYLMSTNCLNLGYEFNLTCTGRPAQNVKNIMHRCKDFLIELCSQLQQRLLENIDVLKSMSTFSPQLATSQIWNLLHTVHISFTSTEDYWIGINEILNAGGQQRYGHICKLVLAILSLPFSNASVERMFSIMNIVKNKLRNKMSIKTTETILRLKDNLPDGCINFEPSKEMIRKFNSENMYSSNFVEDVLEAFADIRVNIGCVPKFNASTKNV
ncbi:hypothetical protein ALC57_05109 [Trachymyrmex cornetzi]|uniref:HAT C-terminal dimerisation domain-containing protein n=1 Tax=Trachymyrmex cornetzi TaxID=471704 RepID=A0A151JBU4_9HYME|nr:hypothetical protein ALC57_05109 [Trachymyrmex cornetzi]